MKINRFENFRINEELVRNNIYVIHKKDFKDINSIRTTMTDFLKALGYTDFKITYIKDVRVKRDNRLEFRVDVEIDSVEITFDDTWSVTVDIRIANGRAGEIKFDKNFTLSNIKQKIDAYIESEHRFMMQKKTKELIYNAILNKLKPYLKDSYRGNGVSIGNSKDNQYYDSFIYDVNEKDSQVTFKNHYSELVLTYDVLNDEFTEIKRGFNMKHIGSIYDFSDYKYSYEECVIDINKKQEKITKAKTGLDECNKIIDELFAILNK